jgi:fatty acid desaturase
VSSTASFSARDVLELVKDHLEPNPVIYWIDFLVSTMLAYVAFVFYLSADLFSWQQVLCFLISSLAFYRAAIFSHEIQHFRAGTFRGFRVVWNLLCGIPLMIPSFLYDDHKYHHVNHSYGTQDDSEYFPLGVGPIRWLLLFLASSFLLPILGPIRFLFVAPVRWLVRPLRARIWQQASSLSIMNPDYRRELPTPQEAREALWQEIGCFCVAWTAVGLLLFGVLPWAFVPKWYALYFFWSTLNHLRTLGAHRYRNAGEPMTYSAQLLDTNTFPGWPLLTELWAPLGLRYHALHHLVPSMPYHEMGTAHRRLMRELPPDSAYRQTITPSLFAALFGVFRAARNASRSSNAPAGT